MATFDDPTKEARYRALMMELTDLCDDEEWYLLIAFIRMVHQFKREVQAKRREREKLEAKLNGDTDTNKLHIVKNTTQN